MALRTEVYPRVCGGTLPSGASGTSTKGLSPRVRGNPYVGAASWTATGSIPACAGEPATSSTGRRGRRVYPRVCGGTRVATPHGAASGGLSPRVRGNPPRQPQRGDGAGSIPACAGEPANRPRSARKRRVYPRVCGGTVWSATGDWAAAGLSPRVRGNRRPPRRAGGRPGSIPACAGEPHCESGSWMLLRVYPRVCGGTLFRVPQPPSFAGLSPRVRGNPRSDASLHDASGSIPACAGEPGDVADPSGHQRVYPRVCGGTVLMFWRRRPQKGLSPRVRGNRAGGRGRSRGGGSIPACAGEPGAAIHLVGTVGVYPRVCGGTFAGRRNFVRP